MDNLRNLDLNLLRTLNVLLSELNVTRAAERLHLSQPSVSVQLAKLRQVLRDPLLLPGPRGMQPTTRAQSLREPLAHALQALSEVVSPVRPFDPSMARVTWKMAATDYSESTVLLPVLPTLRRLAPDSRLAIVQLAPRSFGRQCELGEIDVAFHSADEGPSGLRRRTLFREKYVLVGRHDHPRLNKRMSVTQFCKLEHVIVSPDGGGFSGVTDAALAQVGLQRRVMLSVPHFTFVRDVLSSTDLVAMLPARLVTGEAGLQVVAPPVEVPGYEMVMLWHERSHLDPSHQWVRDVIASTINPTGR
ncbi:transcriptional regulator, LysR family [Burkholderia sp. CF099]|nr:transcriptional regulator, LysR family [Burkholderia sp. CF099]